MHLPDGILSLPVAAATSAVGVAGFSWGLSRLRGLASERTCVLMGMMGAFIFAAQMVNFPVFPGVSGHLMGGVLSAVVLGPWAGACVMASVLIVQALLFADGGLTALGANFVNMGLLGSVVGHAIFAEGRRLLGGGARGTLIGAMIAAWVAVLLSAGACALELGCSNPGVSWSLLLGWMMLIHAAIGLGEAIITGIVLKSILTARPDLIPGACDTGSAPVHTGRFGLAGLGIALAVAFFAAPFAYNAPDGLETVEARVSLGSESSSHHSHSHSESREDSAPATGLNAPMSDYQLMLPGISSVRLATAFAGVVGTLVVGLVSISLARALVRGSTQLTPSPIAEIGTDAN